MSVDFSNKRGFFFDLDGVVFDTEPQYTIFWGGQCRLYHPEEPGLENKIKGQTLTEIFASLFSGDLESEREIVNERLRAYEANMRYDYINGLEDFIKRLKSKGLKTAVVTSSNHSKMESVYRQHPEIKDYFDEILTSEDFEESKPSPCPYLTAARRFCFPPSECVVFEDSFNGIKSGASAGMFTVGLATTNSPEAIAPLCDLVIKDFTEV